MSNVKKKLFLTGASSFLGTKFVDLYGDKYEITQVSRNSIPATDLNDFESVKLLFETIQPDVVVHLAATVGRDAANTDVLAVDTATTKNLIDIARKDDVPFIYTSSEIVYNGRPDGMYLETDEYHPRSAYGESKVISEKYLIESGLPYLITRGHRYIGFPSERFNRPKQFPDTLCELMNGREVHLDSHRLVNLVLIDDICDAIDHYISNDLGKKLILNLGMKEVITYNQLLTDIAKASGLNEALIHDDGEELGWLPNNTLSTQKLRELGYPQRTYDEIVKLISDEIKKI